MDLMQIKINMSKIANNFCMSSIDCYSKPRHSKSSSKQTLKIKSSPKAAIISISLLSTTWTSRQLSMISYNHWLISMAMVSSSLSLMHSRSISSDILAISKLKNKKDSSIISKQRIIIKILRSTRSLIRSSVL